MKPTGEFFKTLGKYVYAYIDDDGEILYYGKGVGDRAYHHGEDKEYDWNHAYIVARNLERFDDKTDSASFAIESFAIYLLKPRDNKVSGRYGDAFIMAKFSDFFQDFESSQHDNFKELPEWYIDNYDSFRGRIREVKITSGNIFIQSGANNAVYCSAYVPVNPENSFDVTFEVNQSGDKLDSIKVGMTAFLEAEGFSVETVNNDKKLQVKANNVESFIELFDNFWG